MAIINCPECGKEISDRAETCIYCGYPLKEPMKEEAPKKEVSGKELFKQVLGNLGGKIGKKGLLILFAAAIVIAAVAVSGKTLNEKEKYVYKVVAEYKDMLKDPDSLVLRGDILYVKDSSYDTFVAFNASGNNSYGTPVTSMPIFMNYFYIGDYGDESGDFDEIEDKIKMAKCNLVVATWRLVGDDMVNDDEYLEAELISGKKIAAKLKCEWKK